MNPGRPHMDLRNVYFVIGTSYAGKSTIVKNLAKKHHGIALEENYHDAKLPELDSREFPGLTYTRDLQDWHEYPAYAGRVCRLAGKHKERM